MVLGLRPTHQIDKVCGELSKLHIGIIGTLLGLYGDNGKENGNYYIGVIYTLLILFLGTLNIRCRMIIGIQTGTIMLTTSHVTVFESSEILLRLWIITAGLLLRNLK